MSVDRLLVQILASGSYDDTIKLYVDDPEDDWFCCVTLTGHKSTVWALAWSPSGQYLASGSDDKTVRVWKRTGQFEFKQVLVLEGHERPVYSVSWGNGNGKGTGVGWLASAGGDGVIRVWEIAVSQISTLDELETQSLYRKSRAMGSWNIG